MMTSCAVKDDIPYPIVEAAITAFEVEGQCDETDEAFAEAQIDKSINTVSVYVSDTVDISSLRILRLEVSNDATLIPDEGCCADAELFPDTSFSIPPYRSNTRVDFSNGSVEFTFRTYQDYVWTVCVQQVMERDVQIIGQVGNAVIDPVNRNVVIYVSDRKNLSKLSVSKFTLGGQHGTVIPDPTATPTFDFSQPRSFQVKTAGSANTETWRVFVYTTEAEETVEATAFARSVSATISGTFPVGSQLTVEYHAQGTAEWTTVNAAQVTTKGANFIAELTGLRPSTTYMYRVKTGSVTSDELTFTTADAQQLENAGFEEWSSIVGSSGKDLLQPWGEGKTPYWGTGNAGATTVGASNSTYVDEDGRRFANLQSKYIVIKFAAGNIFTGDYLETDGSNGVLSFGRPFTSFPTKMRFEYKYKTSTITRTGGDWKEAYGNYISKAMYENIKGQPDSCSVYVALGDWEPVRYVSRGVTYECPYLIRTRPSALHLMDMNDSHLIAFAQMTKGEDVTEWTTETLTLNYRVKNRQPKYIIVVASSSKYGDYFTGGEGSLMQLDNVELLYE